MPAVVDLIEFLLLALAGLAGIGVYLLPSFIAVRGGHPYWMAIVIANALAGWTAIGWIVMLVWACVRPRITRHWQLRPSTGQTPS